ncbi:MAG: cupin domain-containing protein [Magnetovibrionaceae bacterium]
MSDRIRPVSEDEEKSWPKEPLVTLEKPFVDARGRIQPIVDTMMESAVLIESARGTLRANHYHKTDWHYCYVMKGIIQYYHRPTNSGEKPQLLTAKEGEMIFTPPMVDHAMVFPEKSVFLTLGRNPRAQDVYEADVVRVPLVDPADAGLVSWKPGDEQSRGEDE